MVMPQPTMNRYRIRNVMIVAEDREIEKYVEFAYLQNDS